MGGRSRERLGRAGLLVHTASGSCSTPFWHSARGLGDRPTHPFARAALVRELTGSRPRRYYGSPTAFRRRAAAWAALCCRESLPLRGGSVSLTPAGVCRPASARRPADLRTGRGLPTPAPFCQPPPRPCPASRRPSWRGPVATMPPRGRRRIPPRRPRPYGPRVLPARRPRRRARSARGACASSRRDTSHQGGCTDARALWHHARSRSRRYAFYRACRTFDVIYGCICRDGAGSDRAHPRRAGWPPPLRPVSSPRSYTDLQRCLVRHGRAPVHAAQARAPRAAATLGTSVAG